MEFEMDTKQEFLQKMITLLDATVEVYRKINDPSADSETFVNEFEKHSGTFKTIDELRFELFTYIKNNIVLVDLTNNKFQKLIGKLLNNPIDEKNETVVYIIDCRYEEFL